MYDLTTPVHVVREPQRVPATRVSAKALEVDLLEGGRQPVQLS